MASLGQIVTIQITLGRHSLALVTKVNNPTTNVNLLALTDGVDPWPTVETFNGLMTSAYASVAQGVGVGQWQELALPQSTQDAIASAIGAAIAANNANYLTASQVNSALATINAALADRVTNAALTTALSGYVTAGGLTSTLTGYPTLAAMATAIAAAAAGQVSTTQMNSAIAAAIAPLATASALTAAVAALNASIATLDASKLSIPSGATTVAPIALSVVRQPNVNRPVFLELAGTYSQTVLGTGTINLLSDAAATPVTNRGSRTMGIGVGITVNAQFPWSFSRIIPAGHRWMATRDGGGVGTFTITSIEEQVL